MPRRPRVVIPGVPYHITQRGNNREPVFFSLEDRHRYLDLLGRLAPRYGARILGYCLMTNHIHLIAVPERQESLARALGHAHSDYALALNRDTGRSGHLWQNRFFSCPMDQTHLYRAILYIELNPVRAKLVGPPWEWPWSSARAHTLDAAQDALLDYRWKEYLGGWDFVEWKEMLSAAMEESELEAVRRATHRGEPLGSREFLESLERRTGKRLRVQERGRPKGKMRLSPF